VQRIFRLLADSTRLRILAALVPEELAVSEIAEVLAMGQPRISNHLALLREAGLLRARREGSRTFYRNALKDRPDRATLWQAVEALVKGEPSFAADAGRRQEVLERRRARSRSHFGATPEGGTAFALGCVREEILSALAPRGWTVVDAGCGDGYLTELLVDRFERVIAIDHAPERIEAAKAKLKGRTVELRVGEVDALPLPASCADAVFLSLVLHHVPEVRGALREARRVLRPGGLVVVLDLAPHDEESLTDRLGDLRLGLDPEQLEADLAAAGFTNVRRLPVRDRLRADPRRNLDLILVTGEHRGTRRPAPGGKT
jgi:ArsR family transcriptional regulator